MWRTHEKLKRFYDLHLLEVYTRRYLSLLYGVSFENFNLKFNVTFRRGDA